MTVQAERKTTMKRNFYLSGIVAGVALLALMHIVTAQGPSPQTAGITAGTASTMRLGLWTRPRSPLA